LNTCKGWEESRYSRYKELEPGRNIDLAKSIIFALGISAQESYTQHIFKIIYGSGTNLDSTCKKYCITSDFKQQDFEMFIERAVSTLREKGQFGTKGIFSLGFQFLSTIADKTFSNTLEFAKKHELIIMAPLGDRGMQNEIKFCWSNYCRESPMILVGDMTTKGVINQYTNVFLSKELQDEHLRVIWTCGTDVSSLNEQNEEETFSGTSQANAIATRRIGSLVRFFPELHDSLLQEEIWHPPAPKQQLPKEVMLLNHFGLWIHYQVMDLSRPDPVNIREKQQDFVSFSFKYNQKPQYSPIY